MNRGAIRRADPPLLRRLQRRPTTTRCQRASRRTRCTTFRLGCPTFPGAGADAIAKQMDLVRRDTSVRSGRSRRCSSATTARKPSSSGRTGSANRTPRSAVTSGMCSTFRAAASGDPRLLRSTGSQGHRDAAVSARNLTWANWSTSTTLAAATRCARHEPAGPPQGRIPPRGTARSAREPHDGARRFNSAAIDQAVAEAAAAADAWATTAPARARGCCAAWPTRWR